MGVHVAVVGDSTNSAVAIELAERIFNPLATRRNELPAYFIVEYDVASAGIILNNMQIRVYKTFAYIKKLVSS